MRTSLFFLLCLTANSISFGQEQNKILKEKELKELKNVKTINRDLNSRDERNIYDQHFSSIEHTINRGYEKDNFIIEPKINEFTANLYNQIETKNKLKPTTPTTFYIIKANTPNASSLGYNYYLVNSGLFTLADNEFQLAAVLSHELAHNYLEHTKQEILQEAEFLKDFKKEIRSLKRNEMIQLIKSQDKQIQKKYDLAAQSRKKEIKADSLGFIYYSSLAYPKSEYLTVLKKLETYDSIKTPKIELNTYKDLLNIDGLKFNQKWFKLEKDELFSGLSFTEYIDKDSIRSHPNILDRINFITTKFEIDTNQKVIASEEFITLKKEIKTMRFDFYFNNNQYAIALYELILAKQNNSTQTDLDSKIALVFNKLYEGRIKHEFNKYVSIANPNDEDTNYNEFLHFLWSLTTPKIKIIADHYQKKATI